VENRRMSKDFDAVKRFLEGNACSQAVLSHYCELFDLDRTSAIKLASGFGAGMQMGKTCGAVTGAYMVLGLKFGTLESGASEGRQEVSKAVVELTRKFEQKNGTTDCMDLLGCDISTAEGSQIAKEQKLFTTVCPHFVRDVSKLLNEIIARD
jgi:C_GCAxxG_C_C family probable redox protein